MAQIATIRSGAAEDVAAVRQLVGQDIPASELQPEPGHRYLLVLDGANGRLAGAAVFVLEGEHGHLTLLSIAPEQDGTGLEDRLIAVVESMCEAFGARSLDVPARHAA